jgi:ABC-type lipoprotein release transport system permease subunit
MSRLLLMARLALRNVWAHWVKNVIIGVILAFGTTIVVTGAALIDSLQAAMRTSITTSVTANLQVYDANARDELAMLGDMNFGGSDNGEIPDYATVARVLTPLSEVAAVLPMGIGNATVFGANELDRTLEALRAAHTAQDAALERTLLDRVQRIAGDIRPELDRMESVSDDVEKLTTDRASLDRVIAPTFFDEYTADPVGLTDWMDSQVAPLATDGRLAYFRLLGTDLPAFQKHFPRMQISRGTVVPEGSRGILLNESMVEQWLKNPVARELDTIEKAILNDGETIGTSGTLYDRVQRLSRQYRRVLYQLDGPETAELEPLLRKELGDDKSDLVGLLKSFLQVTDENFTARKAFFYAEIAPRIRLYDLNVGDTIPLRAFTKSGYLKSLNVKVYGVYRYSGVAKDDSAAGAYCLIDMPSFRDLYGKMTDQQRDELSDIKTAVGAQELSSGSIEDQLFGGGGAVEVEVAQTGTLDTLDSLSFGRAADRQTQTFTQAQIEEGVATNIAIFLKDPTQEEAGAEAVRRALADAGLELKVVDWKTASGFIGQAAIAIQGVLLIAVIVLFLVALVTINIALVLATLERTGEIGTIRALGAQRPFVVKLILLESQFVGVFASLIGAGAAWALVGWLGRIGLPAGNDFLSVLFGGKALYPSMAPEHAVLGIGLVLVVSFAATLYPALLAARVPPVVALQGKE